MRWSHFSRWIGSLPRLILAFGALATLFCALQAIYLYHTWGAVKHEKQQALASLADLGASSAQLFLQRYSHSLRALAGDVLDAGAHFDAAKVEARLRRFKMANPDLAAIYLFSANGALWTGTTPAGSAPSAVHMADPVFRADFELALQRDEAVVGRTRFGKMAGDWIMPLRMRVKDASGATAFVISAVFATGQQQGIWRGMHLPKGWAIGLWRDDGYLQARHPQPADPARSFARASPPAWVAQLQRLPSTASVAVELPSAAGEGVPALARAKRLQDLPLAAFAEMPRSEVARSWWMHVRVPVTAFALSLAAMLYAAYWSVREQREREAERNAAHRALQASETALKRQTQLLAQSQRAANIGGWEWDLASGELYWTEETYRLHEVAPENYAPSPATVLNFYAPESAQLMTWALQRAKRSGEPWDHELEVVTYKGNRLWVRSTGKAEADAQGKIVRLWGSYQDITQRRSTEERIRHMAHYDSVTGLANRNLFTAHLSHALDRAKRIGSQLAVLFIDLDRFKHINDALGHGVGDTVLKMIGQRLTLAVRNADVLARLGGDEFIVAAEDFADRHAVHVLAQRMLEAIEEPVVIGEDEFALTASIGIAMFPHEGGDVTSLIKNADAAMYRAKEAGKNRFEFYSEELRLSSMKRLNLEAQLRKAVQDGNQLQLHYQPRVSLDNGRICCVEALVRWQHPERGLIAPIEFIPLAEETGLIQPLGAWVLRAACAQCAQWQRGSGKEVCVAVNFSARELYRANLVADVRAVLAEAGLPPQALELEITETAMLHNLAQVAEVLSELKEIGVRLTVDDFGTGYSSLVHLRRLPLDYVKIDRSFVRDIPGDADDAAITRTVIAMAHSLRLKVVAEGVETEAQLRFLQDLNCDEVQGFLLGKPVPANELLTLLHQDALAPLRHGALA